MGEYDWIMDQREQYGDDYIDELIDGGYVPMYTPDVGWRWMLKSGITVN